MLRCGAGEAIGGRAMVRQQRSADVVVDGRALSQ